jgi:hypothetical protein
MEALERTWRRRTAEEVVDARRDADRTSEEALRWACHSRTTGWQIGYKEHTGWLASIGVFTAKYDILRETV